METSIMSHVLCTERLHATVYKLEMCMGRMYGVRDPYVSWRLKI